MALKKEVASCQITRSQWVTLRELVLLSFIKCGIDDVSAFCTVSTNDQKLSTGQGKLKLQSLCMLSSDHMLQKSSCMQLSNSSCFKKFSMEAIITAIFPSSHLFIFFFIFIYVYILFFFYIFIFLYIYKYKTMCNV